MPKSKVKIEEKKNRISSAEQLLKNSRFGSRNVGKGSTGLTTKQQKFVKAKIDGLCNTDAARKAGYSEMTALHRNPADSVAVKRTFAELLEEAIPNALLVEKLREGLDAKETRTATFEGTITDEREYVAWDTRLRYADLALKARRLVATKVELTGENGGPVKVASIHRTLSDAELDALELMAEKVSLASALPAIEAGPVAEVGQNLEATPESSQEVKEGK